MGQSNSFGRLIVLCQDKVMLRFCALDLGQQFRWGEKLKNRILATALVLTGLACTGVTSPSIAKSSLDDILAELDGHPQSLDGPRRFWTIPIQTGASRPWSCC